MKKTKYDPVRDKILFVLSYLAEREKYYVRLKNFEVFGRGWIGRIAKLKEKFLELYQEEVKDGRS